LPSSVCSASIAPISTHSTRQPGKSGSSVRTSTSRGSPSSALVDGTNPKSYGNIMPSGMTLESLSFSLDESYLILFLLPFGVSMITSTRIGPSEAPFVLTVLRFILKLLHQWRCHAISLAVADHTSG